VRSYYMRNPRAFGVQALRQAGQKGEPTCWTWQMNSAGNRPTNRYLRRAWFHHWHHMAGLVPPSFWRLSGVRAAHRLRQVRTRLKQLRSTAAAHDQGSTLVTEKPSRGRSAELARAATHARFASLSVRREKSLPTITVTFSLCCVISCGDRRCLRG